MKPRIVFLSILLLGYSCSHKKDAISFTTLTQTEFNAKPFQLPLGMPDSLKRAHDSCMGFSFDVNAIFIQTRDTFGIGSIVNRQSLKRVDSIGSLGITPAQIASMSTIISNPCYEKRVLQFPLKRLLGDTFNLSVPGATAAVNEELNNAIATSANTEMSTGSWVYLDIRGMLTTVPDTIQSEAGNRYKQNLLDTANMVLTATESVTDIGFLITTSKSMSQPLLTLLQTKPSVTNAATQTSLTLYYISDDKFELKINGFFPVVGQFMKTGKE